MSYWFRSHSCWHVVGHPKRSRCLVDSLDSRKSWEPITCSTELFGRMSTANSGCCIQCGYKTNSNDFYYIQTYGDHESEDPTMAAIKAIKDNVIILCLHGWNSAQGFRVWWQDSHAPPHLKNTGRTSKKTSQTISLDHWTIINTIRFLFRENHLPIRSKAPSTALRFWPVGNIAWKEQDLLMR